MIIGLLIISLPEMVQRLLLIVSSGYLRSRFEEMIVNVTLSLYKNLIDSFC